MSISKPVCFFVMPFSGDMHYFYLYVRKHIEEHHNLVCERADDRVTTLPLSEKVRSAIQKADVIVADCTGRNPNVMYELGLAHAFERKVILLTSDPIDSIPTDLRQFEFVKYERSDHVNFLRKLDGALDNIFKQRYDQQFEAAEKYFGQLKAVCADAEQATPEEFAAKYREADSSGEVITPARLLVFIVRNFSNPNVMTSIVNFEPEKQTKAAEGPPTTLPEAGAEAQVIAPEDSSSKRS